MEGKTRYVVVRMKAIERELEGLRNRLEQPVSKKAVKIEGLWKGVDITEADLARAKRSLLPKSGRINHGKWP